MEDKIIDIELVVNHWRESSDQNYTTMQNLIKSKDYSWALFMGHLVIEKLVKALYVKKMQTHPAFSHDLLRLIIKTGVELPTGYDEWFDKITTFNLNARYDDYKQSFYKLCTSEFTNTWIANIEKLRQWLINQL